MQAARKTIWTVTRAQALMPKVKRKVPAQLTRAKEISISTSFPETSLRRKTSKKPIKSTLTSLCRILRFHPKAKVLHKEAFAQTADWLELKTGSNSN